MFIGYLLSYFKIAIFMQKKRLYIYEEMRNILAQTNNIASYFAPKALYQDWTKMESKPIKGLYKYKPACNSPENAKTKEDVVKITGLSKDFIDKTIKAEELRNIEYIDCSNHRTNGIGHNISDDSNYKLGRKITNEQAYSLFAKDLTVKLNELKTLTKGAKLNQGQKSALMDLLYNVGYGNLENSKLVETIKAGKVDKAVEHLDFISAAGKVNSGICKRRIENVYDYSKAKPSKLALKIMHEIKSKGADIINQKIKATKKEAKANVEAAKAIYIKECEQIINKEKKLLAKAQHKKIHHEKGLWQKIEEYLF